MCPRGEGWEEVWRCRPPQLLEGERWEQPWGYRPPHLLERGCESFPQFGKESHDLFYDDPEKTIDYPWATPGKVARRSMKHPWFWGLGGERTKTPPLPLFEAGSEGHSEHVWMRKGKLLSRLRKPPHPMVLGRS
ncbi:hypothetical protein DM860_003553 [Cuscuta australis]|uniref:Uncharacterized protein n=1 Tax=Cuscuta australis TaxID=267555 RepID=A0A328DGX7_9ASTE|nr:hypothetical protein DM860_003553 [Cuscuta australis]